MKGRKEERSEALQAARPFASHTTSPTIYQPCVVRASWTLVNSSWDRIKKMFT